jgi:hypothetical protein
LGVHSGLDVGVEDREAFGHLVLTDPHVVEGLVDRDVPEDALDRR